MCVYYLCKRNSYKISLIPIIHYPKANTYLACTVGLIFVFRLAVVGSLILNDKPWILGLNLAVFRCVARLKYYTGEMMGSPTPSSQFSAFGKLDQVSLYGPPPFGMPQRVGASGTGGGVASFQSSNMAAPSSNMAGLMGGVSLGSAGLMLGFPLGSSSLQQQQQQQQRSTQQSRPQQPSPSRNMFNMGQHNLLTQLTANMPPLQGLSQLKHRPNNNPLAPSGLVSGVGGSNFSRTGLDSASTGFDLSSDFPILNSRTATHQSQIATSRNYVGMVSKPQQESAAEFQIQQEDFPALPGAQNPTSASSSSLAANDSSTKPSTSSGGYDQVLKDSVGTGNGAVGSLLSNAVGGKSLVERSLLQPIGSQQASGRRGIQTHPDGTVTNIPSGMVMDQFGIIGLLAFIRASESDPNLVALAPGIDLTTLGLNLNSPENLYSSFKSPWEDSACRPQDIDYHVPVEYLTNVYIKEKLAPIKFNRYQEDLLFYLFYVNPGDVLQLVAAAELYNRDWRYHKDERVWITRAPGMEPQTKTKTYERGTYVFFDIHAWRRVPKEFHLEYSKLEERPQLPEVHKNNA